MPAMKLFPATLKLFFVSLSRGRLRYYLIYYAFLHNQRGSVVWRTCKWQPPYPCTNTNRKRGKMKRWLVKRWAVYRYALFDRVDINAVAGADVQKKNARIAIHFLMSYPRYNFVKISFPKLFKGTTITKKSRRETCEIFILTTKTQGFDLLFATMAKLQRLWSFIPEVWGTQKPTFWEVFARNLFPGLFLLFHWIHQARIYNTFF